MHVYTLQPDAVLQTLLAGSVYRPDLTLCRAHGFLEDDEEQLLRAYQWIANKLSERDVPPHPEALPVWVWHTFDPQFPKPDLRRLRPYSPGVLLELEIEQERVLLSDFELWHAPLNGTFLDTEAEYMAFEEQCERRGFRGCNDFWEDKELSATAVASWDHCLDLDWYAPDWFGEPRERKKIQGVMWEIRPADLVRYRHYKGWTWREGTSVCFGDKPVFDF